MDTLTIYAIIGAFALTKWITNIIFLIDDPRGRR